VPFNRESKRSGPEDSEIVGIMGVLPNIFSRENQILPKRLLQTSVEFITPSRRKRSDRIGCTNQKRVQHRIGTPGAGEDQVFIKRSFQHSCIRSAKNCVGFLHVISNSKTWLGFTV